MWLVDKEQVLYGFCVGSFEYEFEDILSDDYFGMLKVFLSVL